MSVGILALQGDVAEHRAALASLGVASRPVKRPEDLRGIRGLVLPGGESTTLSMLLDSAGLYDPLVALLDGGLPVLATCAGLILLAREVRDGRPDQRTFGVLDVTVRRNGYGRQAQSFEAALDPAGVDAALDPAGDFTTRDGPTARSTARDVPAQHPPLPAVFIRAPRIESVGPEVEVLAELAELTEQLGPADLTDLAEPRAPATAPTPVLVRQGNILATAFHPELTPDRRTHRLFAARLPQATTRPGGSAKSCG